jgi:hypothetical protein
MRPSKPVQVLAESSVATSKFRNLDAPVDFEVVSLPVEAGAGLGAATSISSGIWNLEKASVNAIKIKIRIRGLTIQEA